MTIVIGVGSNDRFRSSGRSNAFVIAAFPVGMIAGLQSRNFQFPRIILTVTICNPLKIKFFFYRVQSEVSLGAGNTTVKVFYQVEIKTVALLIMLIAWLIINYDY